MSDVTLRAVRATALLAVLIGIAIPAQVHADDEEAPPKSEKDSDSPKSFGLFVNPLSIAFGYYGAEFDYSPTRMLSLNLGADYYSHTSDSVSTTAVAISLGTQVFVTGKRSFEGLYLYPRLMFAAADAEDDVGSSASATLVAIGATAGYQWDWASGLALRLGVGGIYYAAVASESSGTAVGLDGAQLALDASLGWTF